MIIDGKDNLLNSEVEDMEEEELDLFDFMVEDKDESNKACLTCKGYRVGNQICGTFKCTNDFYVSKGRPNIEDWFSCVRYKEV